MEKDLSLMNEWAGFLKRWGLTKIAISLLGGAQPVLLLLSQLLIIGSPFITSRDHGDQLSPFIAMLEDEQASAQFARYLQLEGHS